MVRSAETRPVAGMKFSAPRARGANRQRSRAPGRTLGSGHVNVIRSVGLFVAAGLAEIGGGYLIWRWLREGASWPVGLAGAIILVVYGVIPTLQPTADFGRVYAAYGGVFVIMSLLWGWAFRRPPAGQVRLAGRRHRRGRRRGDLLQPAARLMTAAAGVVTA